MHMLMNTRKTHRGFTNFIRKLPANRPKVKAPWAPARNFEAVELSVATPLITLVSVT